jgi:hypothetical protein
MKTPKMLKVFFFSIISILAIILPTSCNLEPIDWSKFVTGEYPYTLNDKNYQVLTEDLNKAWYKVSKHTYISEQTEYDDMSTWPSPLEFEAAGQGNCIGFSVDLIYHLGKKASLCLCTLTKDGSYHAIVKYNDKLIEPQLYGLVYPSDTTYLTVTKEIEYDKLMAKVTAYGTK